MFVYTFTYLFVYYVEVPEEEYDPRSLFERLQEQKDKKQEEFEEQFKFRRSFVCFSLSFSSSFSVCYKFSSCTKTKIKDSGIEKDFEGPFFL